MKDPILQFKRFQFIILCTVAANSFLTYSYKQRINVEGLQIILEISDDMINWNSGSNYLESIPSENDPESGIEKKSFRSIKPVNSNRSQFFRLKIVLE